MPIFPAFPSRRHTRTFALVALLSLFGMAAPTYAESLGEISRLLKSDQHAKALEQVDRYLAGKPQDAQGRFLKGVILTGLNRQNEAIAIFQKLAQDYPDLPEPHNNLAVIYAQQKQYDKAKEALEKAIRTHPAYATAHENLGDIYSRLASQAYGKALQIDASNASAQTKLAMINDLVGRAKVGAGGTAVPAPAAPATPVAPPAPIIVASAPKPAEPVAAPPPAPKPVEAKPVEVKPESANPAKPAASTANTDAEIIAAVDGWLAAWSKKDVKAYLGHYAKDFQTPGGQTRKAWETERAQRIGKPGRIEVGRDKLGIKTEGEDKATVRFRQNYKSAGFNSSTGKTLILIRQNGKWLIQQERAG